MLFKSKEKMIEELNKECAVKLEHETANLKQQFETEYWA